MPLEEEWGYISYHRLHLFLQMSQMIMKGIVCLQVYKRILEATLFSTVAGQERGTMGLSKCSQLCQAYGGNFTKTSGEICVD